MSSSAEEESNSGGIIVSDSSFPSLKKAGGSGSCRRPRQRVDAGEPRNSYASIPNFCSRPASSSTQQQSPLPLLVPSNVVNGDVVAGYNRMLSSPPLGTKVGLLANSESGDSENSGDYQRQSDDFVSNGNMKEVKNQPLSLVAVTTSEDKSVLLREILQSGNNNNNNNKEGLNKSNLITRLLKRNNGINGGDDDDDDDDEDDVDGSDNEVDEDLEERQMTNRDSNKTDAARNLTIMCDEDDEDDERPEVSEEYEGGDEDEEIEDEEDVERKDKSPGKGSTAFRPDEQLNGEMMEEPNSPLSQSESKDEEDEEEDIDEEDEELTKPSKSPNLTDAKLSISATSSEMGGGISSMAGGMMSSNASEADLKRARVENIISTMRSSPHRVTTTDTGIQQVNGCKKRKLYQPQQHEAGRVLSSGGGGGNQHNRSFRLDLSDYEDVEVIDVQRRIRNAFNNGDGTTAGSAEVNSDDYSGAKRRKLSSMVGQDVWKEQVSEMQAQIAAIQKKLTDLYDVHSSDSDGPAPTTATVTTAMSVGNGSQYSASGNSVKEMANGKVQMGSKSNGHQLNIPTSNMNSNHHNLLLQLGYKSDLMNNTDRHRTVSKSPMVNDIIDPIHFIDEARRLVHEQERLAKMEASSTTPANSVHHLLTSTPAEPKVAATAAVATACCHQPGSTGHNNRIMSPDWEVLADNLKAGMSTLIDDWVRQCSSTASTMAAKSRNNAMMNNNNSSHLTGNDLSSTSIHINRTPIVTIGDSLKELAAANQHQHHQHQQQQQQQQQQQLHHHQHHQHNNSTTSSPSMMIPTSTAGLGSGGTLHLSDRKSPRTKVIDRGRLGGSASTGGGSITSGLSPSANAMAAAAAILNSSSHNYGDLHHLKAPPLFSHHLPIPPPPLPSSQQPPKVSLASLYVSHQSQLPFYGHLAAAAAAAAAASNVNGGNGGDDMCTESPEQSGPLSLVVTPKKKRSKVTDKVPTRTLNRHFVQSDVMETSGGSGKLMLGGGGGAGTGGRSSPLDYHHNSSSIVPVTLPTSVAIPNPSLVHQSDMFSSYPYYHPAPPPLPHAPPPTLQPSTRGIRTGTRSPSPSESGNDDVYQRQSHQAIRSTLLALQGGGGGNTSPDLSHLKSENGGGDSSECNSNDMSYDGIIPTSSTLTPMHLRKAKLMFFFVRYPSSSILKAYFPDIKFNKNNTAQLVKWFSNFREFYYIQMEKYARQAMSEGCKSAEDLIVTLDSELYRVLNLHYNRNNHIEVPTHFRYVVEQTLREFFKAVSSGKDSEQSWKKAIYKVIARLDDNLPDYFKSPNFLEQLE